MNNTQIIADNQTRGRTDEQTDAVWLSPVNDSLNSRVRSIDASKISLAPPDADPYTGAIPCGS